MQEKKAALEALDRAFSMLGGIPVRGDSVELLAAAKQELRNVYAALQRADTEEKGD